MPAYTKADFDAAYGFFPVEPGTDHRLAGRSDPAYASLVDYDDFTGIRLRLHYHPYKYRQEALLRAQRLIAYLDGIGDPLDANSSLVIVGGAFGWLGEALISLVPGLAAVSVDLSDYVQASKDSSPDDDLIAAITAQGYDHTLANSVGEYLFNLFSDPTPRATIAVSQEDLSNNGSRNRVRNELPRDVTRGITEEVWQVMTQQEKDLVNQAKTAWSIPVTHIIDGLLSEG